MPTPKKYNSHAERTAAYRQRLGKAVKPVKPHYTSLQPGYRRWSLMLESVQDTLQAVIEERQEYFDERSEAWQESGKSQEFSEKSDTLQEVLDTLEGLSA